MKNTTNGIKTRNEGIKAEAMYQGRNAATEVLCGAPDTLVPVRARWEHIAAKAGWQEFEMEWGWLTVCDVYHYELNQAKASDTLLDMRVDEVLNAVEAL